MNVLRETAKMSVVILVLILLTLNQSYGQKKVDNSQKKLRSNWAWNFKSKSAINNFEIIGDRILVLSDSSVKNKAEMNILDKTSGKILVTVVKDDFVTDEKGLLIASEKGLIEKIDMMTGKAVWQAEGIDFNNIYRAKRLENIILIGVEDVGIIALDAQNGKRKWVNQSCLDSVYHFEANSNTILIGCPTNRLFAIDSQTGKERWQANYFENEIENIFLSIDSAIAVLKPFRTNGGLVEMFDSQSGTKKWSSKNFAGFTAEETALLGNKLILAFSYGKFVVVNTENGETILEAGIDKNGNIIKKYKNEDYSVRTSITKIKTYNENTVIGYAEDGWVYAFDLQKDGKVWSAEFQPYAEILSLNADFGTVYDETELKIFSSLTGKVSNKFRGDFERLITDNQGDLYFLIGEKDIYKIAKLTISKSAKLKKDISLPVSKSVKQDVITGRESAVFSVEKGVFIEKYSDIVLDKESLYLTFSGNQTGRLLKADQKTGKVEVVLKLEPKIKYSKPTIYDGTAYFTSKDFVWAVDVSSKKTLWKSPIQSKSEEEVFISRNTLLYSDDRSRLVAHNKNDGSLLWRFDDSLFGGTFKSRGNSVFVLDNKSQIIELNIADGSVKTKYNFENTHLFEITEDKIIVFDLEANLKSFDRKSGQQLWNIYLGKSLKNINAIKEDFALIETGQNHLLGVDLNKGVIKWERKYYGSIFAGENAAINRRNTPELKLLDYKDGTGKKIADTLFNDYSFEFVEKDGIAFFRVNTDELTAYSLAKQKVLWTLDLSKK